MINGSVMVLVFVVVSSLFSHVYFLCHCSLYFFHGFELLVVPIFVTCIIFSSFSCIYYLNIGKPSSNNLILGLLGIFIIFYFLCYRLIL